MTEPHLAWTSPDGGVVVRIAAEAVTRLNAEAMRGFGVTRRRGTELGGVLLGRTQGNEIWIEGMEGVPCEYAFGPSYRLSPGDKAQFEEVVARTSPVGYFRSDTREVLAVDDHDAELAGAIPGAALVLLIRPYATRSARAVLYTKSGSAFRPGSEFQFAMEATEEIAAPDPEPAPRVPAPRARASRIFTPPEPPPAAAAPTVAEEPPVPPPAPVAPPAAAREDYAAPMFATYAEKQPSSVRPWLAAIAFALAAGLVGAVAGYQVAGGRTDWRVGAAAAPDPWSVTLRAATAGDSVAVTWDRACPAVERAGAGVLTVTDATGASVETRLTQDEVRRGMFLFATPSATARFRLDVYVGQNRYGGEIVDWRR